MNHHHAIEGSALCGLTIFHTRHKGPEKNRLLKPHEPSQ
ncbi:hypothetical protein FOMG_03926 [Fusarium oxysporum f. sp. melonis 26406]|uniref:Uncharacterized protein n=2 Tax=Fusarium oxysporum TaxID=5507 RepID=W9J908_FUSOX|nr:hypothetical protein FOYG_01517 [Fusarium oxysporum NRRL 32931]EWZ93248.1 hypothetical protein FOWG_06087 [Fusarium oxysporum f. sp. lycopersici MN25]EXK45508.1 hypothetical protein FOMG_03926 [Fusarium oxysporum f. sp. melonis 26406]